jgi:hypothetical protein
MAAFLGGARMIDTERDRAICEAATPGPWIELGRNVPESGIVATADYISKIAYIERADETEDPAQFNARADAAFIAHARTALPAYIEEVERLRAELAESKRREQAAVELIPHKCYLCVGCANREAIEPIHGGCPIWQWRGPDDRKER